MKTVLVIATIILTISGAYAFNAFQQSRLNERQLIDYEKHVKQLLSQVEANSLQ